MSTNRREFIERAGTAAFLGALPIPSLRSFAAHAAEPPIRAEEFDFSWTAALKGRKYKGLFDCTEVESGYGVWRASIWATQYQTHLGARPADIATVLVLRHNAIVLAVRQELWDSLAIGSADKVTHPVTQQATDRNPALLSAARNEVPQMFDAFSLPNFLSRGGIALACNLALQDVGTRIATKDGVSEAEAMKRAVAGLVPGVVLMPSGVLACMKAQEEGCHYVKAS